LRRSIRKLEVDLGRVSRGLLQVEDSLGHQHKVNRGRSVSPVPLIDSLPRLVNQHHHNQRARSETGQRAHKVVTPELVVSNDVEEEEEMEDEFEADRYSVRRSNLVPPQRLALQPVPNVRSYSSGHARSNGNGRRRRHQATLAVISLDTTPVHVEDEEDDKGETGGR